MTTRNRQATAQLEQLYEAGIVDAAAIAYVAGVSTRSVARWKAGHAVPRKQTARRLRELVEIIDLARRVLPGSMARSWLRSPNPSLGPETPLDLIADGRHQCVADVLNGLAEGVTA